MKHSVPLDRTDHAVTLPIEDYERLKRGFERYEFVRCLTVRQFAEMLVERNLKEGIPFDELVDIERAWKIKQDEMNRMGELRKRGPQTWVQP